MSDLIDALKLVKKAYKPKLQKLKMTPEQVKQKVKVHQKVTGVLQGMDKLESLQKESLELVAKLVKTFVEQAPTMLTVMQRVMMLLCRLSTVVRTSAGAGETNSAASRVR